MAADGRQTQKKESSITEWTYLYIQNTEIQKQVTKEKQRTVQGINDREIQNWERTRIPSRITGNTRRYRHGRRMDDKPTKKKVLNTTEWTAGENADEADVIQMCSTQNTTHRHRLTSDAPRKRRRK